MDATSIPPAVRLVGRRLRFAEFVVFVREPGAGEEVRVRVTSTPSGWRYQCDACGDSTQPRCAHALAAAQLAPPRRPGP